ncbi:sad1/unc-84-like protein-related [Anaeramoeba flamelloides]|uniref:Sad1/unc-84-like protein-related n=1 Tax=Anaeramoeba flamelloides TaxID=1746091 RepID=A0ABQ8Y1W2_9EUKA|nr:sad1/unc-84-like protein-related [Anaeramoeba flamelloides]
MQYPPTPEQQFKKRNFGPNRLKYLREKEKKEFEKVYDHVPNKIWEFTQNTFYTIFRELRFLIVIISFLFYLVFFAASLLFQFIIFLDLYLLGNFRRLIQWSFFKTPEGVPTLRKSILLVFVIAGLSVIAIENKEILLEKSAFLTDLSKDLINNLLKNFDWEHSDLKDKIDYQFALLENEINKMINEEFDFEKNKADDADATPDQEETQKEEESEEETEEEIEYETIKLNESEILEALKQRIVSAATAKILEELEKYQSEHIIESVIGKDTREQIEKQIETLIKHEYSYIIENADSDIKEYIKEHLDGIILDKINKKANGLGPDAKKDLESKKMKIREHVSNYVVSYATDEIDWALLDFGASIVKEETSPTAKHVHNYQNAKDSEGNDQEVSWLQKFYHQVEYKIHTPSIALTKDISPSSCWPMEGNQGKFTVKLKQPIYVNKIGIDHIPEHRTRNFESAPRRFEIKALIGDKFEKILENQEYTKRPNDPQLQKKYQYSQTWEINTNVKTDTVQLNILSNWGEDGNQFPYTCLYRFRVYGDTSLKE